MNWKVKLLLFGVLITAVALLIKLPSQADTNVESSTTTQVDPIVDGKFTVYPNGVVKIEPRGFAISRAVRDMPTRDPDALRSRALFVTKQQKAAARLEILRQKGLSEEEIETEAINRQNARVIKKIVPGAGLGKGDFKDPLIEKDVKSFAPQAMPTPSLTFRGASQTDNFAAGVGPLTPPDVNGDVGPNHYVSAVNLVFKIFDKNGNTLAGPVKTNSLFENLPADDPCRVTNDGDPIVLYDSLADRWHISQFAIPTGTTSYQCVALSVTGDPTGAYYVWSYGYPGELGNDFPKVGVWTDGYHMTFNQFSSLSPGARFVGLGILTQDRKKALAGDSTALAIYFNVGSFDRNSGGALPGDIDGFVGPPEGLAQVIGEFRADEFGDPIDGLRLYKWAPDFSNPANTTAPTVIRDLPLAPFDANQPSGFEDIEQMGGKKLDSVSDRSMHRFAYRNFGTIANPINSYVGNFSVNVSGVAPTSAETYQAGIRWFEVRRTNDTFSVFDQGTHNLNAGDGVNGLNNWMGAIAQDNKGNIALGFSQAGNNQFADIKIAGRTNNFQSSSTLNEGEVLFHKATGAQTGSSRWGDYSSMNVDPTDDCTFWYTQEYYETTSSSGWSSRVGKFKFPQCTPAPTATITGTVTFCANGALIDKVSVDATGGFNRITGANEATGRYAMTVSPGTYTVTAGKAGGLVGSARSVTVAAGQTVTADFCLTGVAIIATNVEPKIVSESCGLPNDIPDPSKQITVSLPLQNTGAASTTNLTATLQATGGVTNQSAAQSYGALAPGSAVVNKNFTFAVAPNLACGSSITLTFNIDDGATSYGTVTKTFKTGVLQASLTENFDRVTAPALPAGWTSVPTVGTGINWVTSTASPSSPPNTAFAANSATVNAAGLISPAILIQTADAQLSFKNFYHTEEFFDGMVLEYSTNNGTTWTDIEKGGGSFVSNGYNGEIAVNEESPILGRRAWTGSSNGFLNTVVNLPASLNGQNVQFRWLMASDSSLTAGVGVRVDDVQILGKRECAACSSGVCQSSQTKSRYDFDGERKSDLSVFRPSNGVWYLQRSGAGFTGVAFGLGSDKIVPADYDGDNKTDVAVYRDGTWYLQRTSAGFIGVAFGAATDIPQPADFDGDGKADLAVFRPSNGGWYVYNLATNKSTSAQFGASTDKPVVGDYDGDCKADYAVFRPAEGNWYVQRSKDGITGVQFGSSADQPVPADYDGDGKTDIAVFRPSPSNGTWYLLQSTAGFRGVAFGFGTDLPVPADYDGDGKADVAVFRNGTWYLLQSTNGFTGVQFGEATDRPIPNAFVP